MCTSIVVNTKKTIIGWNLDILDMEYRVRPAKEGVFIEINDATEGWMPLFGANSRGDFVGMPTCWPTDARSDPEGNARSVILLDIDLLLQKKTLQEIRKIVDSEQVCSIPGLTFMSSLSDIEGNVLIGVLRFQKEHLGNHQRGGYVVYFIRKKDDAIVEQTRVDVVTALTARRLLDDVRYQCRSCFECHRGSSLEK